MSVGFIGGSRISSNPTGLIINGIGDSITARCIHQPGNADLTNVPQWQPSTPYTASQSVVQNNGLPYVCTGSGTSASSGGPTGQGTSISDGGATWAFRYPQELKTGNSWLTWVEAFSCGRISFRLSDGYGGLANTLVKVIVVNGGSNYSPSDTITLNNMGGATASLNVTNGAITSVTITKPGNNANAGGTTSYTINTSTGSGAVLAIAGTPSGTFATQGAWTSDAIGYLPDACASSVDIFVVHIGTNDINNNISYSTITTNLRTIWETLIAAGKRVVVVPIQPKSSTITTVQNATLQRVNKFIRAYYRQETWANPNSFRVGLADPTGLWTDGTSNANGVIGGTTGTYPAVTLDGLHPSTRGAQLAAWEILQSLQRDLGITVFDYSPRTYSAFDGASSLYNPGGNVLEGLPWVASTVVAAGDLCANGGNVYYCTSGGTTASSGGPSGTGSGVTDGGATWNYAGRKQGMSTFISGTTGTQAVKAGITYSGSLATGWTITRISGTASGTIKQAIESPWSNGQKGQRQVTNFSLGGGTSVEHWAVFCALTCQQLGLTSADFGNTYVYLESEVEVSALQNCHYLYALLIDTTSNFQTGVGNTLISGFTGSINNMLFTAGETIDWPNDGKVLLRSEPILLPSWFTTSTSLNLLQYIAFDASGAAGTATATLKQNYFAVKRWGVA